MVGQTPSTILTDTQHDLPGYGLPLDCYDGADLDAERETGDQENYHPWPIDEDYQVVDDARYWWFTRRTILENAMLSIINAITDKPGWIRKLSRRDVRTRWKSEASELLQRAVADCCGESTSDGEEAARRAAERSQVVACATNFCFTELDAKALHMSEEGFTTVLSCAGADIIKTDHAVPDVLREKLRQRSTSLQQTQPIVQWHPGQEDVVRNLIHPSIHPLHYDPTKALDSTIPLDTALIFQGRGEVLPTPSSVELYSTHFQWLPAEVSIDKDTVYFTSYINGLDYTHYAPLYENLAELIGHCVPLWEQCVAISRGGQPRRVPCDSEKSTYAIPSNITERPPRRFSTVDGYIFDLSSGRGRMSEEQMQERQAKAWAETFRYPICPAPAAYEDFAQAVEARVESFPLRAFGELQIIVKMSNIELSPDHPRTTQGAWHVEGLPNEHICATAIFYYDSDNVRGGSIRFRGGASMGLIRDQQQDHYKGLQRVYGTKLQAGEEAIQDLPTVATRQGRLLVFPNVFQHAVEPVELIDNMRPGHRKIVVLWLVNPEKRIISTANVPPQQPSTMTPEKWQRCREVQLELMQERSAPDNSFGKVDRQYNFCEH